MMRRIPMHVAVAATGAFMLLGGSSLRAAEAAPGSLSPFVAPDAAPIVASSTVGTAVNPTLASTAGAGTFTASIGVETGEPLAANSTDGVAAIPLPPSAYPGMVGLATAALSVWRYRRRRR